MRSIMTCSMMALFVALQSTAIYSYDAQGRLVKVDNTAGPAAGVETCYALDDADNRTQKLTTTGTCTPATLSAAAPLVAEPAQVETPDETSTEIPEGDR